MNRIFQGITSISIVIASATAIVAGCAHDDSARKETNQRTGTVQMSLSGVGISGTEYRLRYATFGISGASDTGFSSEDYLDMSTVRLALRTGAYLIELDEAWTLERRTTVGYEPVEATLVSDNPVAFTIAEEETTHVSFRFQTSDEVVTVGWGNLDVSIEVVEPLAGAGGSAGVGGAGNTGGTASGLTLEIGTPMEVDQQNAWVGSMVATGDLDGDGWPDLALAHGSTTGAIAVNQHEETFAPEVLISESWWDLANKPGATGVTLADLDLDGDLDYVFGLYGDHFVEKKIQVYEGDGKGNHAIPTQIPQGLIYELDGANPMGNQVADFDHNGLPDIVSGSNNGAHTADIILQTSPWVFSPTYAYNQNGYANPQWLEVGDLNNDGWMDLVVPFIYGPVEVYLNTANGTGAMTHAGGYLSDHHQRAAVADFNGDGFQDIVARSDGENHVDILYNDGAAHFPSAAAFAVSGSGSGGNDCGMVRAGDLDGDGTMDLVVCSCSTSTVDVLLNDGMGSFHAAVPIAVDEPPDAIALDDFDQDGDLDVAVYTRNSNVSGHVRVLWNRRER